jgi:hypothetical protein
MAPETPREDIPALQSEWYQEKAVNMLHWLHSLLPHIPHYGYVLVFIVVLLNNLGLRPYREKRFFWGPGLSWENPQNRCGNPWRRERQPVSWAAFVPFGWDGGWAKAVWKELTGSISRTNG